MGYALDPKYPAENSPGWDLSYTPRERDTRLARYYLLKEGDVFACFDAEWLVEEVSMSGGGTQSEPSGATSVYNDEYTVTAVKLDKEGFYQANGDRIRFFQTGGYHGRLFCNRSPKVLRRMRKLWAKESALEEERAGGRKADGA